MILNQFFEKKSMKKIILSIIIGLFGNIHAMKITLPDADKLADRISEIWGDHFIEKTELDILLGGKELELKDVAGLVESAYLTYKNALLNPYSQAALESLKPKVYRAILRESPQALENPIIKNNIL